MPAGHKSRFGVAAVAAIGLAVCIATSRTNIAAFASTNLRIGLGITTRRRRPPNHLWRRMEKETTSERYFTLSRLGCRIHERPNGTMQRTPNALGVADLGSH